MVYDMPKCSGLCKPTERMLQLHALPECLLPPLNAQGELPHLKAVSPACFISPVCVWAFG